MDKEICHDFKKRLSELVNPTIKGRIHMDEKCVRIGTELNYDLNAIDSKTKFVVAHRTVKRRTMPEVITFLREIKDSCYDQLLEKYRKEQHKPVRERKLIRFVSDGFENYRNAFNKLFYRVAELRFGVPIACKKYGLEHNNNPIERYNEGIAQRYKIMRGFKSFKSANSFLEMRRIIYNFVNPHMELDGRTPAEEAGILLPLNQNRLLSLIRYCYIPKT